MSLKINLYYVYILTSERNTVLYTGITNDLLRRWHEHKIGVNSGFTKRYNVKKLVYYEKFDTAMDAIFREKQIKGYSREKKINLINKFNPDWSELLKPQ